MAEKKMSPAFQLMIQRKQLVREATSLDPFIPNFDQRYRDLMNQANDLLTQAQALGGMTPEEAQSLALL
jgi:hypothetical protein